MSEHTAALSCLMHREGEFNPFTGQCNPVKPLRDPRLMALGVFDHHDSTAQIHDRMDAVEAERSPLSNTGLLAHFEPNELPQPLPAAELPPLASVKKERVTRKKLREAISSIQPGQFGLVDIGFVIDSRLDSSAEIPSGDGQ